MSFFPKADVPLYGLRGDFLSLVHDTFAVNAQNKINQVYEELQAAAIGTTNAETTAARPYNTSIGERLDQTNDEYFPLLNGFEVTEQGTPNMTVQVAAGHASYAGAHGNIASSSNSTTITAPTTNNRFDVIVFNMGSNTIGIQPGTEDPDPVYPNVGSTQIPLAIIALTPATVSITDSIITDCRLWGAYTKVGGKFTYYWKGQDAINALDDDKGGKLL